LQGGADQCGDNYPEKRRHIPELQVKQLCSCASNRILAALRPVSASWSDLFALANRDFIGLAKLMMLKACHREDIDAGSLRAMGARLG
jgi:hypothetical protein